MARGFKLRYGFKAEANRLVAETRNELGLSPSQRLDPLILAKNLEIPIMPLSVLAAADQNAKYLLEVEPEAFSAMTLFMGPTRQIIYNDAHLPGRISSDIMHELAHAFLGHSPRPALNSMGCRDWDDVIEREAEWLSGALLIPDEAAFSIAWQKKDHHAVAQQFGVSEKMVAYRVQVTGAHLRVQRSMAFRERAGR